MIASGQIRCAVVAAVVLAASVPGALALERVSLRNGFSYDCARQETVEAGRVRLFTTADGANFIDIAASEIAGVEMLPDPPVVAPAVVAHAPATDIPALLRQAGSRHNIDVELLNSVVHTESGFHARAVSRAGARGLMQLMPGTAAELGVGDAFEASENIAGGSAYLDALLTRYHDDLKLALAAYNAGPAAVDRYRGVPPYPETVAYVARVMNEFKRRKAAAQHTSSPAAN